MKGKDCAKDLIVHQESEQKEEMQPSINWGKQDWHRGVITHFADSAIPD